MGKIRVGTVQSESAAYVVEEKKRVGGEGAAGGHKIDPKIKSADFPGQRRVRALGRLDPFFGRGGGGWWAAGGNKIDPKIKRADFIGQRRVRLWAD